MSDPLSVAAGIVGIVATGFKVAHGLYQIGDVIGSAGEEVRSYAGEIDSFSNILNRIRTEILGSPDIPSNVQTLIEDATDICARVIAPFDRILKTLEPLLVRFRDSPTKLEQVKLRVVWMLGKKQKLLFYRSMLNAHHATLNTTLQIATLQTTKDKTPQSICILQFAVKNSLSAVNISYNNTALHSAGAYQQPLTNSPLPPSTTHLLIDSSQNINSSPQLNGQANISPNPPQLDNLSHHALPSDIVNSGSVSCDFQDTLTEEEAQCLEKQVDDDIDPDLGVSAVELYEDTRSTLRKAQRLALEMLRSNPVDTMPMTAPPPIPVRFTAEDYTVSWICTRPIEFAASEAMLDDEHPSLPLSANDPNVYGLGRIGRHNVVLICIPAGVMDTGAASTAVSNLLRSFPNIQLRLMTGIASGIPSQSRDIRLGDVVVGASGSSSHGLILLNTTSPDQTNRTLETPPRELGSRLSTLQARHLRNRSAIPLHIGRMLDSYPHLTQQFSYPGSDYDVLFSPHYDHYPHGSGSVRSGCSECDLSKVLMRPPRIDDTPMIHYGPIAWVGQATDACKRDEIGAQFGALCLDSEAVGLMNYFPCLVVRGVWSYGDSHKDRRWQPYAAATAAGYAKELLEML